MFWCCRPPTTREDGQSAAGGVSSAAAAQAHAGKQAAAGTGAAGEAAALPPAPKRRSSSSERARQQQQQQQLGQISLDPLARLGEGAAQQAPGLLPSTSPHAAAHNQQHHVQQLQQGGQQQQQRASEDAGQTPQSDVLQLVALLQELLGLSTASPRQPLSKAMGLLVVRLPVDWACLHVFSANGRVVMQVGAALSPEAQRQRGASGSCSYATPVGSTPVRQRMSYNSMLNSAGSSSSNAGTAGSGAPGTSAGVQEVGAGHLAVLPGSGSSLELVSASRQALAMYVGDESEAAALPPDWQRLYSDRDLRSFLVVPIIASGSAGSIIGALSFGLTSITDWGAAWWMSSIQLLCGWAAGALPQNRATARAAFFDALWSASDLQEVGRVFVQQLPSAMADQAQHKLEARLALVSSRVASCVMFAGVPDGRTSQEQQLQQQQQQQQQQQPSPHLQQQWQQGHQQLPDSQQQQQQLEQQLGQQQQRQQGQGRSPSPASQLPEGVILDAADDSVWAGEQQQRQGAGSNNSSTSSRNSRVRQQQDSSSHHGEGQQPEQQQNGVCPVVQEQPVSRFSLPTSNSVLLSALEWGEVMVVKDTVTYFGRNAGGSSAVRDLFLPDRPMVRGTLVLLPLVYRCRAVGCVYLLAPWDIHAELGKAALQEMAALLAAGTFKALLRGGRVQQDWYSQVLSEGPMPSVPELDTLKSTSTQAPAAAAAAAVGGKPSTPPPAAAAAAAAMPTESAVTAPLAQADQQQVALPAAAALSAAGLGAGDASRSKSPSPAGDGGWGSGEGQGMGATGSCESIERSAVSTSAATGSGGAGAAAGGAASAAVCSNGGNSNVVSCPLPLSTAEAVIAAAAAAQSAAAAAAAIAPVGLPVSGHAASGFLDLVLWPELLDIKADLARSRHTAVYNAEFAGHLLAVKLFRYSTAMDYAAGAHPSQLHGGPGAAAGAAAAGIGSLLGHPGAGGSGSGGNWASEAELEAVLSLQYRLCNMSHPHLLQHVAVYPRVYEVVQRRSSREPPDVYLAAMLPRKERHHRCAALVLEHAAGGCLRDAVNRGQVHVPTPAALQAAAAALGWVGPVDVSALGPSQLQELMGQVTQQLPLIQQPTALRTSHEYSTAAAAAAGGSRLQQASTAAASALLSPPARSSLDVQHQRQPFMPLLRQLLLQIALGMQHLHAHGIIHGELRLDNVMISGAMPTTMSLMQQQQQQVAAAAAVAAQSANAGAESTPVPLTTAAGAAATGVPTSTTNGPTAAEGELVGRTHSSAGSYSTVGLHEGAHGSSSSSQIPGSTVTPSAGSLGTASSTAAAIVGGSGTGTTVSTAATPGPAGPAAAASGLGFVLKLKDIGLCTLGYTNRQIQCTLRKLAGRPRLQAVSWLAPECFRGEGLSKYSDVYAFGILMWELYTGQVAFNDLVTSNTKVLQTIIGDGVRPQFPESAPAWYVTLANRCWAGAPKSRPSFRRIVHALQSVDEHSPPPAAAAAAAAAAARG